MATKNSSIFDIPTLFQASALAVVQSLTTLENELWETPDNIKLHLLHLMCKRGLITDDNMDKVASRRARVLDLTSCKITDTCLLKMSCMKNLQKIDMNCLKETKDVITSKGIISVAKSCPRLQIVYLRRNVALTDPAVQALAEFCPMLRELDVGGCRLLTDSSLEALGQHSQHLKSLNIREAQISDIGLNYLCQGRCASKITELDVTGCREISDDGVEIVLENCSLINTLLFAGCPKVTESSRIAMQEKLTSNDGTRMKQVQWTIY